jgi:hypothetical protein
MLQQPPAEMEWLRPWERLKDSGEALVKELQKELPPQHVLYGVPVIAVARRIDCYDVLLAADDPSKPLAVVHLTWAGRTEQDPRWPSTTLYRGWQDWIERCLVPDHQAYSEESGPSAASFHANHVVVSDEEEYFLVGFADYQFDPHEYLLLQRAHEFDEQDIRLEMDNVYIERNDQSPCAYGGIHRFELNRDRVRVGLDERTAAKIGLEGHMEIRFDLDADKFGELRTGLARMFEGRSCFVDTT